MNSLWEVELLVTDSSDYGSSHQCYVCKPLRMRYIDNHEMRKVFPETSLSEIPYCHEYAKSQRDDFIRQCPEDSAGCLTKFEAGYLSRTCARVGIEDCKEINGVTYCYCKGELCNTPDRKLSMPKSQEVVEMRSLSSKNEPNPGREMKAQDHAAENEEGSGEGFYDIYDSSYFDDEDGLNGEQDKFDMTGNVDVTEPPSYIQNSLEEEAKEQERQHAQDSSRNINGDIDFEDSNQIDHGISHDTQEIPPKTASAGLSVRPIFNQSCLSIVLILLFQMLGKAMI
ncbi:uncharacterized protein LOC131880513 isoform X2 [Tigriopus californicus]|uniref:uncharacterized protein LOC131880513 isoform X2 n=1 Tax=Tigriopus californicus TaxID=6832 RepID=UPI0027DA6CB7|nr:uncharacterized protein LOC131880513 isoform X2 [Tigriopus californicus]